MSSGIRFLKFMDLKFQEKKRKLKKKKRNYLNLTILIVFLNKRK